MTALDTDNPGAGLRCHHCGAESGADVFCPACDAAWKARVRAFRLGYDLDDDGDEAEGEEQDRG